MDENTIMHAIMAGWIGTGVLLCALVLLQGRNRNDPHHLLHKSGLLTAGVGTLTVIGAVFVPFGVYTTHTERPGALDQMTTRMESLWTIGIEPFQVLWLALVWGAAITVAVSALVNHSTYTKVARWVATLVLIVLAWLSSFTIGWMFVPVTLLALLTAILGARIEEPGPERTKVRETG